MADEHEGSKLELDDLNSVTGGAEETVEMSGEKVGRADFDQFIMGIFQSKGLEYTSILLEGLTGYKVRKNPGTDPDFPLLTDEGHLRRELNNYWKQKKKQG